MNGPEGTEEVPMKTESYTPKRNHLLTRRNLQTAGVGALALVAVPILAVLSFVLLAGLAFAFRVGALTAILVIGVVGLMAYAVSPRFREWYGYKMDPNLTYSGLRLDTGVAVHPTHAWMRLDGDEATVGVDDLVQAVLGPVETVELPEKGTEVRRGEVLFRLRRGDRSVAVRSPVTGKVLGVNQALAEDPHLCNESPFCGGWAVRLSGDDLRQERRALHRGPEARGWFRKEVDRLLADLLPGAAVGGGELAPTLPDGGELSSGLYREIDDVTWRRVNRAFFSAPPETLRTRL